MSEELTAPRHSRDRAPTTLRRAVVVATVVVLLHAWTLGGGAWLSVSAPSVSHAPDSALRTRLLPALPMPPAPQAPAPQLSPPPSSQTAPHTPPPTRVPAQPEGDAPAQAMPPNPTDPHTSESPPADPANVQEAAAPMPPEGQPPATATAPVAPPAAPAPAQAPQFAFPPPVVLNYDVVGLTDGQKNVVSAAITWKHDGMHYQASLVVTKFLLNLRQWTSKGQLTVEGLAPVRFGEKGWRRAEVAAHFVRDEGRVVFSANAAPVALLPGAQDHLSVFMQLASLWAGAPQRWNEGDVLTFQSIGPRQAETWTFIVSAPERISVPGGSMQAFKLTREASGEYSTKAELWLAPQLHYLPARIRLSEPNGNVLDMVWSDSQTTSGPG